MRKANSASQWTAGTSLATTSDRGRARDASCPTLAPAEIFAEQAVDPEPSLGEDGRVDVAWIGGCVVRAVDADPDCGNVIRDARLRRRHDLACAPVCDRFSRPRVDSLAEWSTLAPTRSVRSSLTGVAAACGASQPQSYRKPDRQVLDEHELGK